MVLLVLDKFQVIVVIHLTSMILLGAEGTARKEKSARPGKGDPKLAAHDAAPEDSSSTTPAQLGKLRKTGRNQLC